MKTLITTLAFCFGALTLSAQEDEIKEIERRLERIGKERTILKDLLGLYRDRKGS